MHTTFQTSHAPCLPTLINPHRTREIIHIIRIPRNTHSIPRQHTLRPNRVQSIDIHIRTPRPLHTRNPTLTRLPRRKRRASSTVIAEKRVQARSIHKDVLAVEHPETPSCCAVARYSRAGSGEVGVVEGGKRRKGNQGVGGGLVVRCFGLDHAHENVLGRGELVLVENVVLGPGAVEPEGAAGGFDVCILGKGGGEG